MIFDLMYAAIGTNRDLSQLFVKTKRFAVWFGKCTHQKGFFGHQKCRGEKKIIGRLHSKINTRFDKMAYNEFNKFEFNEITTK